MMDAFVVKFNDVESVIKHETGLHLQDSQKPTEPPVKKIKHDEILVIEDSEASEDPVGDVTSSSNNDVSFESVSSATQSDASPEQVVAEKSENCIGKKENTSSPKPKRRKLSVEQIEQRKKVKEEARLAREQRRQEKLKKEQEKEEIKLKKEKERQAKKEQLEKEKQAKKEQMEKERMEKQMRKEKLEKERLEKQKKKEEMSLVKEEERKKREEERKQKEEDRRVKEEEKRKKEEEKRIREEEEQRKKDKVKESFKSFFIKKSPPKKAVLANEKCQLFAPFEVKPNMKMAPVVRRNPLQDCKWFSEIVEKQESGDLYLFELKKRKSNDGIVYVTRRTLRTKENFNDSCKSDADDDIIIVENEKETEQENNNIMHVKLLQFSENYRPPYYGTWRKISRFISPRNPFKKDENLLNYEVDSDEEWEEEEPGESLSGPENDDDDDEDDENDEENDGFFVPHGYLSDDEGVLDSDGEKQEEKVDIRDKKLDKTDGFPFEEKGKLKQLRATCFGPAWFDSPENVPDFLSTYNIVPISTYPIDVFIVKERAAHDTARAESPKNFTPSRAGNNIPLKVPEEAMPLLINFVHKNRMGLNKLTIKFLDIWRKSGCDTDSQDASSRAKISKRQLERKILEIAKRASIGENGRSCYFVHRHVLDQYKNELDVLKSNLPTEQNRLDVSLVNETDILDNSSIPDANRMAKDNTSSCEKDKLLFPDVSEKTVASVEEKSALSDSRCSSLPVIDTTISSQNDEINNTKIQRELITI